MKTSRLVLPFAFLAVHLAALATEKDEIGFIEKFALAADREAVLGQLIPGSEEFYFYHALHYQNSGQAAKLKATLADWTARFPKSAQRRVIENRAALLSYDADPQATLAFLKDRLKVQHHHVQEARDKKPNLPTTLDQARIARSVFEKEALRASSDLNLAEDAALDALVREKVSLTPEQRRSLLARIARPDVPGLVELVEADLRTKESKGFGEFPIHRALLPEQLDGLARRMPALFESQAFVFTRLRKMRPGADADPEFDAAEREAWMERVWAYAKNLSPGFNTLKGHILFHRLIHDRARGVYDRARFLEYLKLPRKQGYVARPLTEHEGWRSVDLSADLNEALVAVPPIGNDEWLVREYLLALLPGEASWEPWATYLRDTFVKPIFAEAKIVAGVGDPAQWASLLAPQAFQKLKDRVDLDFAPTAPQFFNPADDASLELLVKNVPKLLIKVYEINTLTYFLAHGKQLNTDLNLDGLVANFERTQTFEDAAGRSPFRRVARTFALPELKGKRGAWMVEFIGGGKSSRALVRKGQWHVIQQTGPAGDMLTVLDESREPVADAAVWLEGRKYTPDATTARIIVPFTAEAKLKPIIVADATGSFASLTSFNHHDEDYQLDAQFHIEREQLIAGKQATLAVRTALLLGDAPIPPGLLKDARLTLTSKTLDGISTSREITGDAVKFDPAKVFTHVFAVPDRIAEITVTLRGSVEKLSAGGEKQELTAQETWHLNGIDKTDATNDGHLSKSGDAYVFELLGKAGEPLIDQQVVFDLRHYDFKNPVTLALRSDERGRMNLGALTGIEQLTTRLPNGRSRVWQLQDRGTTRPGAIHARSGEAIDIPWLGSEPLRREEVSLLEQRAGTFAADHFSALSLGKGVLQIKSLPPGDYLLLLRGAGDERSQIAIRITAGKPVLNWLVSASRDLEVRDASPLYVESVQPEADAVVIQLRNANPFTRVHVVAGRFAPEIQWDIANTFRYFARRDPAVGEPPRRPNLFAAGRAIGDEYRYILERRFLASYPGNMLARPGLLLNPWEVRSTDLDSQEMAIGEARQRAAGDRSGKAAGSTSNQSAARSKKGEASNQAGASLDFLNAAAPALYNLVPDANGIVRIDRKALGDRQHVHVYAEDLGGAVWRSFALPEQATKFRDLRLTRSLDPTKPFTERKTVSVLAAGQTLTVADVLAADLETYDSLASIFTLFSTLSGDATLARFAFILQWPKLSDAEKRARYSEFACHELSYFLSRKDPAFFKAVAEPYLRNKKDKTFMDDYLLVADLQRYLTPWAYERLNVAERALLAQRLPAEAGAAARHLRELWELCPPTQREEMFSLKRRSGGGRWGKKLKERELAFRA